MIEIEFRVAKKYNDKDWLEHHGYDGSNKKDYFVIFEVDEIYFDTDCIHGKCSIGSSVQSIGGDYDVVEESFDTSSGDILIQFTGLKDKNGKGIYDGDIVQCGGSKYIVHFSEDRAGWFPFATDDGCGCCSHDLCNNFNSYVIGNIHENKDLLDD